MSGNIRITDLIDVAIVAAMVFAGIVWLRHSRARFAALGIGLVAALYLVVGRLGFQLTAWILQAFLAVVLIVTVIVFQDDLRRLFERIALVGLGRRTPAPPPGTVEIIARALAHLANRRRGALLVVPGREPLERHLEGGVALDGELSEPLLLSIFDPGSPGHDGAVVVRGSRVERFAVHLPLSDSREQLGSTGTRHAAALGLAERCDALCVVVSEERGTISLARDGRLRTLRGSEGLSEALRSHLAAIAPTPGPRSQLHAVVERWPEALAATAIAAGLWLVRVPGSDVIEIERMVPVRIDNLPAGYELEGIEPPEVEAKLSGTRWDLFRSRAQPVVARVINPAYIKEGRRSFDLRLDDVEHPSEIEPRALSPNQVRISLRQTAETKPAP